MSNYYSFADNYGRLGRIHYILKYSCILTLASKLKLGTKKQVFKKFGKNISIIQNDKIIASFPDESFAKPHKFSTTPITQISPFYRLEQLSKATFRTKAMFDASCLVCGSTEDIEIHHVRKLREATKAIKKDYLTAMMSRMNRKQVPLCKSCHNKLHKGQLHIKPYMNEDILSE